MLPAFLNSLTVKAMIMVTFINYAYFYGHVKL